MDWKEEGLEQARELKVPLLGLLADAHSCNAESNAEPLFAAAPEGRAWRLPGADHCEFEAPSDLLCRRFCADESPPHSDLLLQETLMQLYPALLESIIERRPPRGLEALLAEGRIIALHDEPEAQPR